MAKIIKQNKNTSAIIITALLVVVLVAFLFISPVFAESTNGIDFSGQPFTTDISSLSLNSLSSSGVEIYNNSGGTRFAGSLNVPFYFFAAFVNGAYRPIFCTIDDYAASSFAFTYGRSATSASNGYVVCDSAVPVSDSAISFYYFYTGPYTLGTDSSFFTIPFFNSVQDGLDAVSDYIGGSSSGSAVLLSPSSLTVGTSSYLKSSMSDVSAVAYVDNGSSYSVVVGNINYNNFVYRSTDTSTTAVSLSSTKDFSGTTLYYNSLVTSVSSSDANPDVGVFSSVDDALNAIYQLLDTSGGAVAPRTAYDLNLDLPPGNVAFIDITGVVNDDAFVTCDLSGIALYSLSDWQSKMNYRYGFVNDIPSQFSVPLDGTIPFQWEANSKATVTGTYSSFRSTVASSGSLGHYLVIVNPLYNSVPVDTASSVLDSNAYNTNNYLHIACQANNYVIVALKANIGYYDGQTHYDDQSSGSQYQGTYNPETETWTTTNPDGVPANPQLGGDTNVAPESVEQESKNFIAWLKNFLKGFVSIFDAGKGAITTLVGYSADFFHSIGNLYSWLPPSVLNVLTSSLVLVFVIGVIKVFL